jgi:pimeloyl-ACP methyl ester carboxylesterase
VAGAALGLAALALGLSACAPTAHGNAGSTTRPAGSTSTSTSGTGPTGKTAIGRLAWHACDTKFRCASLVVPVSYSHPSAGTLKVAVIELPAVDNSSTAPDLVMNPGGPGASGIQFLEGSATGFPAPVRNRFNLVSFDPRGIGQSDPVTCVTRLSGFLSYLSLPPVPTATFSAAKLLAADKTFAGDCAAHTSRTLLANISTADTARDMDRLRVALGQQQLDYLGFSYGTYLGTLYAEMFPSHVGAMVLDGAIDPALGTEASDLVQAEGFEADLHDFFAWCPTNSTCSRELSSGAAAEYSTVMKRLEGGATLPANLVSAVGGSQPVDYGLGLLGVIASLYSKSSWPYLAQAISEGVRHNGTDLAVLAFSYAGITASGKFSNLLEANAAISCLDHSVPTDVSKYPGFAALAAKRAPDFGAAEAWGPLGCLEWPVHSTTGPAKAHLARPLPILVVGSTRDPATPYAWAKALTSQLAGAELLTRTGDGHTGYFSSTCVQRWVDSYLLTMKRPPVGTVCASTS